MRQVVLRKYIIMKINNKALKIYTVFMIILSFIVLLYCFFFYLDYAITYKYTIDNGFSNSDIILPKDKRETEISCLLILAKSLMCYFIFVIIGLVWWIIGKINSSRKECFLRHYFMNVTSIRPV